MQPQFHVFAGPDGSGKSHLINSLRNRRYIHKSMVLSSEDIAKKIAKKMQLNFSVYRIKVSQDDFLTHIRITGLINRVRNSPFLKNFRLKSGKMKLNIGKNELNNNISTCISSYLAVRLFESKQNVCYETDLSHPHILSLLKIAQKKGYNTSLFFVCTDSSQLNNARMRIIAQSKNEKHNLDTRQARDLYNKSLSSLKTISELSNHTYIIDNSKSYDMVAELTNGKAKFVSATYPEWLKKYYNPRKR